MNADAVALDYDSDSDGDNLLVISSSHTPGSAPTPAATALTAKSARPLPLATVPRPDSRPAAAPPSSVITRNPAESAVDVSALKAARAETVARATAAVRESRPVPARPQMTMPSGPVIALTNPDEHDKLKRVQRTAALAERIRNGGGSVGTCVDAGAGSGAWAGAGVCAGRRSMPPPPAPPPRSSVAQSTVRQVPRSNAAPSLISGIIGPRAGAASIESLLASRSLFETAAAEDAVSAVLARADTRGKIEAYAEQLAGVTSRPAPVWDCAQCKKTFDREPQVCRAEGHAVTRGSRTMYALGCKGCGARVFHPMPTSANACTVCGKRVWLSVSVHRFKGDRAGAEPSLDGLAPKLMPRGEEQVNSLRYG